MNTHPQTKAAPKRLLAALAVTPLLFAFAACSSDTESEASGTADASTSEGAAGMVPQEYRDSGITFVVGTDYPPYHFTSEEGELVGVNVDISRALGETLDVEYEIEAVASSQIIAGMQANRYDVAIPAFGITDERLEVLDFVTYVNDQAAFMTLDGAGIDITEANDLCGYNWGVSKGTQEEMRLRDQAPICESEGLPELEITTFNSTLDGVTAVLSKRVDGATATYSQLAYASTQDEGKFEIAEFMFEPQELAIGLPKGSDLAEAILAGMNEIQASGEYSDILASNGVEDLTNEAPKLVTE